MDNSHHISASGIFYNLQSPSGPYIRSILAYVDRNGVFVDDNVNRLSLFIDNSVGIPS